MFYSNPLPTYISNSNWFLQYSTQPDQCSLEFAFGDYLDYGFAYYEDFNLKARATSEDEYPYAIAEFEVVTQNCGDETIAAMYSRQYDKEDIFLGDFELDYQAQVPPKYFYDIKDLFNSSDLYCPIRNFEVFGYDSNGNLRQLTSTERQEINVGTIGTDYSRCINAFTEYFDVDWYDMYYYEYDGDFYDSKYNCFNERMGMPNEPKLIITPLRNHGHEGYNTPNRGPMIFAITAYTAQNVQRTIQVSFKTHCTERSQVILHSYNVPGIHEVFNPNTESQRIAYFEDAIEFFDYENDECPLQGITVMRRENGDLVDLHPRDVVGWEHDNKDYPFGVQDWGNLDGEGYFSRPPYYIFRDPSTAPRS